MSDTDMTDDHLKEQWETDCRHWQGTVLKGRYSHWCYEWDSLPVDETCQEFKHGCSCFSQDELTDKNFKTKIRKVLDD